MKTRPLAFALLLALAPAAALPPRVAYAQTADDATTKMARQRFQEGVGFYDKGQFEMARAAFLQAYALRKHPTVLLNLAQSSLKSGHTLEAARYFQQFLKEYSNGTTEAQRADATHGLGEARMKLGRIDVIGATVGADVFVDDERVGMAPLDHSVDVEPGTHTVRSQGPNGEQSIPVTAGMGQGVVAKFSGSAAATAPPPAAPAETSPEPAAPPSSESEPAPTTATPAPPISSEQHVTSGSNNTGWVIASVVTGVVAVAGFAVAGGMAVAKGSAQSSANAEASAITNNYQTTNGANANPAGVCYGTPSVTYASACNALASDNNNVNADATVANAGIIVGVVGLAGFVVSVILATTQRSSATVTTTGAATNPVTVAPVIGKGLGGMNLGFSF